tara:strand:- start:106230 stop:107693 length:1464 start_codon:yes stop_codon:yes gene_type:complete
MTTRHKVIIIDDDKLATHNWKVLFNFIGEDVVALDSESGKKYITGRLHNEHVLAIMLGKFKSDEANDQALVSYINAIHSVKNKLPLLLQCPAEFIHDKLPESAQAWTIQLPKNPDYQTLIRLLEYARQLIGLQVSQTPSRIINEQGTPLFRTLVGESESISRVRELMQQVSKRNANVLLLGESGTGKEIVARNIHYHSGRGDKEFIAVNCAAEGMQFEPHFFGHSASYQDAGKEAEGYLERADGGTLFLDRVTEISPEIQARLLSFLENKNFHRLGENQIRQVDVRLVVATNEDLKEKVAQGNFREDLYYLLNVFPIYLPPLREHPEDIPTLLQELITRLEHEGLAAVRLNSRAVEALKLCQWSGNVRELTNLIERLSIIHEGKVIGINDLPPEYRNMAEDSENQQTEKIAEPEATEEKEKVPQAMKIIAPVTAENLRQYLKNFEKEMLETAMQDSGNIKKLAAARLGMDKDSFNKKILSYALVPES